VRVFLSSNSRYPAAHGGNGASRVNDGIAKGLAELGHEVLYRIDEGIGEPLPAGITAVDLDYVVFYEKPFRKFDRILQSSLSGFPRSLGL